MLWSSKEDKNESASSLEQNKLRDLLFSGVFGVVDSGRMDCAPHSDTDTENTFWVGYTEANEVTSLFV